jgi:hypothetical protein
MHLIVVGGTTAKDGLIIDLWFNNEASGVKGGSFISITLVLKQQSCEK